MATSSTYALTVTASSLITDVFMDVGVIGVGESITDDEMQNAIRKLNNIIKQLEGPPNFLAPGKRMWQRENTSLTLDATKNSYSLRPADGEANIEIPEEIIAVVLQHKTNLTDTPLKPLTHEQYIALGSKSASVTPTKYYYEKRTDEGELYLDGKPTAACVAAYNGIIYYRQPLEIISSSANEFDVQPEYFRALHWVLARELAATPAYAAKADFQMASAMAIEALTAAGGFEPETSTEHFQPGKD